MANNTYNIKMLRQDFYSLEHDLTPKKRQDFYSLEHDLTPKKVMHSVDYAMTNIQEIRPTKIVSSVPEDKIWIDQKFVGCADAI